MNVEISFISLPWQRSWDWSLLGVGWPLIPSFGDHFRGYMEVVHSFYSKCHSLTAIECLFFITVITISGEFVPCEKKTFRTENKAFLFPWDRNDGIPGLNWVPLWFLDVQVNGFTGACSLKVLPHGNWAESHVWCLKMLHLIGVMRYSVDTGRAFITHRAHVHKAEEHSSELPALDTK